MAKVTKAEFEALPESLKSKFKAEGEDYVLIEEDVSGLVKNKKDLLDELKNLKEKYGDLDPDKAREALQKITDAETADAIAKGKWEELEQKLRDGHNAEIDKLTAEINREFDEASEKDLRIALGDNGVGARDGDVDNLAIILRHKHIKPVKVDGKRVWKSLDDTQIVDLKTYIPTLNSKDGGYESYFKPTGASGSGASGSGNGGGGAAKTMPESQFDAMGAKEQAAFINSGGKPV